MRKETEQTIAQGVFGVPTFTVDGELFWGNDQLEDLELFIQGQDSLDRDRVDEMLARDRGIDRKSTVERMQKNKPGDYNPNDSP